MWTKLIDDVKFNTLLKILPTKGKLVYEYNPFRNYRLSLLCFEYNLQTYNLGELYDKFGIHPDCNCAITKDENNKIVSWEIAKIKEPTNVEKSYEDLIILIKELYSSTRYQDRNQLESDLRDAKIDSWVNTNGTDPVLREAGELLDFNTNELKISLDHPVQILPLYSYDGSVNLIINDGINIPRLINSRFSATGNNTYEIVDRKGNNDTNIYDHGDLFNSDTSLIKHFLKIPQISLYNVITGGNMKVGNYHFYFRLADADGNETDFIGESRLVSLFVGEGSYSSVTTGLANLNCFKQVQFFISNLDSSYDYLIVYYSRSTAEGNFNAVTEYNKIDKKFVINNHDNFILTITGYEDLVPVTLADINPLYYSLGSATTMATCQNMLFFGNIKAENIPYEELADLSLHFLPYLKEENYDCQYDKNYGFNTINKGYIDPKFIYNKTGYWNNEIYRLGVVYILPNGKLSPVFNIRGGNNISTSPDSFSNFDLYDNGTRNYISYDENTNYIINGKNLENVKGVVSYKATQDTNTIYSLDISVKEEVLTELKKYVKGYFFVRQERIPLTLAQAMTITVDKNSGLPTIPTLGGILLGIDSALKEGTHVETSTPTGINFISEGFMSRYKFDVVPDHKETWKKALKITGIVVAAAAVVAATIFTAGAAGAALAAGAAAASAAGTAGAAAGAALAAGAIATMTTTATTMVAAGATALLSTAALATVGTIAGAGLVAGVAVGLTGSINAWTNNGDEELNGRNTVIEKGMKKVETVDSRLLDGKFEDRIVITDYKYNEVRALLCPDYTLNQSKFNQVFTGDTFVIESAKSQPITGQNGLNRYFLNDKRHFYVDLYQDADHTVKENVKIITVPEGVKAIGLEDFIFRSKAGEAEEVFRYEQLGNEQTDMEFKKINTDIVRGIYSPYLAMSKIEMSPVTLVDIKIPNYTSQYDSYFLIRMLDSSPFKAISDRININDLDAYSSNTNLQGDIAPLSYSFNVYSGDCYLCLFTQRIIRNFNDPTAPYNEEIINKTTWKDNYDPENPEKYADINSGDVNAVPLGMWVTFRLRSSRNLNIRTLDGSNVSEAAASGHERGYYPYHPMSVDGSYKIPESDVYNKGFTKELSDRINVLVPDVPHIKNWFGTRIVYSDLHITDAFKNGFRVFLGNHYKDYTREYGVITKIVPINSNLLIVFEHGLAIAAVNERAIAGEGAGGKIYLNTSNVLSDTLNVISDMYGSQWAESVLKVPGRNGTSVLWVYGVDTVAKKIWRTDGNLFLCISDNRVQSFLNNSITLGEREITPKIGIRNVKTLYNAYKQDVLFTFYDNTYGFEEKVWNLCWNELMGTFVTFYSWIPSYMENINNIPFSFNRDTSKWVAKLGVSHSENSFADGITLSNVIVDPDKINYLFPFTYVNKFGEEVTTYLTVHPDDRENFIGVLDLKNRILPVSSVFYKIDYTLERDNYKNYELFEIVPIKINNKSAYFNVTSSGNQVTNDLGTPVQALIDGAFVLPSDALHAGKQIQIYALKFKNNKNYSDILSELYYRNKEGHSYADTEVNQIKIGDMDINNTLYDFNNSTYLNLPIYKDLTGKRRILPRNKQINPDKLVRLLNIKANISIEDNSDQNYSDAYYNMKAGFTSGTKLISAGYYESTVAIIPKWNMQFLSTDFWKHGQAGIIDITDTIKPTYWYGKQHPFEFECVVVNDPSVHKIFTNLELIANKAKPESFHYEINGDTYDFAKDKKNMYFRQEAMKALWQYNGADICYNRNFLQIQPKLLPKSADFPHKYYTRLDTINDIEDYYITTTLPEGSKYDYKHLSGAEIVYYPNRDEYRIWQHAPAINIDDLSLDDARSVISGNCRYLEDKWRININPILVCYKNEKQWIDNKPPLPVMNSPIPDAVYEHIENNNSTVDIPEDALSDYNMDDIDLESWLGNMEIARKEIDVKDKFMKVRIRYSGEELAIIDFLNTIYRVSYG